MANFTESPVFEAGIYQLETTDPVLGGPSGISNLQAKQLANRTKYLKDLQDTHSGAPDPHPQYTTTAESNAAIAAAVAALVNSSPNLLDTLSELANALGNDANFATTITNALALKAALASPAFSGTPTAPTPATADSSTKLASTAFVKNVIGDNFASTAEILAGIVATKSVSPLGLLQGLLGLGGGAANDSITIPYRDKTDGSKKFLIMQWGSGVTSTSGNLLVAFPISFPNACRGAFGVHNGSGGSIFIANTLTLSNFNAAVTSAFNTVDPVQRAFNWFAIGN